MARRKNDATGRDDHGEEVGTEKVEHVSVKAPEFSTAQFNIRGTAPLVQNHFSKKAADVMRDQQAAGDAGKNTSKKKQPKDFESLWKDARHCTEDERCGIPCTAFRSALISACRVAGFAMTKAKLSIFVVADAMDRDGETGLVLLTKGEPVKTEKPVVLPNGSWDIRSRPRWSAGWEASITLEWDADQFRTQDVVNLLARAGKQVGVGEGRPDSKKSNGQGWGTFEVLSTAELHAKRSIAPPLLNAAK